MPRRPNVFAGPYLDRLAHLRKDEGWLEEALHSDRTRLVPIHDSRNLLARTDAGYEAVFLDMTAVRWDRAEMILLGQQGDAVYFAIGLADPAAVAPSLPGSEARYEDLRTTAGHLPGEQAGILAYARAMLHWRHRHRFCGACGSPTASASAGPVM